MKKLVLLAICFCGTIAFAQKAPQEVTLVVSADGATKTQAIDNALRSAIEQTFGTFVSANTEILNDELVKDEIATVSSGNIQKYSEIAAVTLPNGNTSVTINVTVSLAKLVSYAQSKGSECEFAGATFGANLRMYEFNKKNERIAIRNMIKQLDALRPVYDYKLVVSEPIIRGNGKYAEVSCTVMALGNEKTTMLKEIIDKTLTSLARNEEQAKPLMNSGFSFHKYYMYLGKYAERKYDFNKNAGGFYNYEPFYMHNSDLLYTFSLFFQELLYDFSITDNLGGRYFSIIKKTVPQWYYNGQISGYETIEYPSGNTEPSSKTLENDGFVCYTDSIPLVETEYNIPIRFLEKISTINIMPDKETRTNIIEPSISMYDYGYVLLSYFPFTKEISKSMGEDNNPFYDMMFNQYPIIAIYLNGNDITTDGYGNEIRRYDNMYKKMIGLYRDSTEMESESTLCIEIVDAKEWRAKGEWTIDGKGTGNYELSGGIWGNFGNGALVIDKAFFNGVRFSYIDGTSIEQTTFGNWKDGKIYLQKDNKTFLKIDK